MHACTGCVLIVCTVADTQLGDPDTLMPMRELNVVVFTHAGGVKWGTNQQGNYNGLVHHIK